LIYIAIVLGLVEGLTEFLPVSSTGHLIVAGHLLGYTGPAAATFEIFIQLGAILAVVWEYRRQLAAMVSGAAGVVPDAGRRGLARNLAVAFLPAGLAGFVLMDVIERHLFNPITVAGALVAGGVAMLAIEWSRPRPSISSVLAIPLRCAFWVGMAQVLSLFPGVSRAAATIMGGMVVGLDRRTSTEFSFYLAIPTMLMAAASNLWYSRGLLSSSDLGFFAAGFVVAFVSALLAVRSFLRFVSRYDLKPFAWYRIALGVVLLLYLM